MEKMSCEDDALLEEDDEVGEEAETTAALPPDEDGAEMVELEDPAPGEDPEEGWATWLLLLALAALPPSLLLPLVAAPGAMMWDLGGCCKALFGPGLPGLGLRVGLRGRVLIGPG